MGGVMVPFHFSLISLHNLRIPSSVLVRGSYSYINFSNTCRAGRWCQSGVKVVLKVTLILDITGDTKQDKVTDKLKVTGKVADKVTDKTRYPPPPPHTPPGHHRRDRSSARPPPLPSSSCSWRRSSWLETALPCPLLGGCHSGTYLSWKLVYTLQVQVQRILLCVPNGKMVKLDVLVCSCTCRTGSW